MKNLSCKVPPTIIPPCKRIIAIGDIHGDWKALIKCLSLAKLIDKQLNWSAQPLSTIVIQLGDQVDRGGRDCSNNDEASEVKIFDLLDKLHCQAKEFGGGVYSLIGNHELINTFGDMRFTTKMSQQYFGNSIYDRIDAFKPGGPISLRFACTRNVIMKIGSFIFVHGGILPQHLALSLEKINQIMRQYLIGDLKNNNQKYFDEYFLNQNSLLWSRKLAGNQPNCQQLNITLNKLDVNGLVIGHTPQMKGISSSCQNKIWKVDTGMSAAFCQSKPKYQVLEILDDGQPLKSNIFKPFRVLK